MKKVTIIIIVLLGMIEIVLNSNKELDTKVIVNGNLALENNTTSKTNSELDNIIKFDNEITSFEDSNVTEVKEVENKSQSVIENKEVTTKQTQTNIASDNSDNNESNNNKEVEKEEKSTTTKSSTDTKTNNKVEEKNTNNNVTSSVTTDNSKTNETKKEVVEEKVTDKVEDSQEKDTTKKEEIPKFNQFQKFDSTNKTITLVDKSGKYCAQALDYFYEDSQYVYYFTCKKSESMYVIKNGKEYKLVEALKTGVTTIKELEDNGYTFLKKAKNYLTK